MNLGGSWWIIILMVVIVAIFIISSVGSRKRKRTEKQRRQKEVKDALKLYMRDELQLRHKMIEFKQVVARNGREYRYRDVFDVIVELYDSKKNNLYATKAFEIEGFSKAITKKQFETIWKVNCELDLDETLKRISLERRRKTSKITLKKKNPEEKKLLVDEKAALKASIQEEKDLAKARKEKLKNKEKLRVPTSEKFSGTKEKQ